jgi:acyl-CoA thioesterase
MDRQILAKKVVQKMYDDDEFSQWLGIEILKVKPGFVKLQMQVRPEMTNGFKVSHGGIPFSLADSALAFASNTYGRVAVALENNISFVKKVKGDDTLTAVAEELNSGRTIGVYNVTVTNQDDREVALFRGTVYRTGEEHFPNNFSLPGGI